MGRGGRTETDEAVANAAVASAGKRNARAGGLNPTMSGRQAAAVATVPFKEAHRVAQAFYHGSNKGGGHGGGARRKYFEGECPNQANEHSHNLFAAAACVIKDDKGARGAAGAAYEVVKKAAAAKKARERGGLQSKKG